MFDPWVRKIPRRREWLPMPRFLPGDFHGPRSLVDYSSGGHKESDTTEQLTLWNSEKVKEDEAFLLHTGNRGQRKDLYFGGSHRVLFRFIMNDNIINERRED